MKIVSKLNRAASSINLFVLPSVYGILASKSKLKLCTEDLLKYKMYFDYFKAHLRYTV